MNKEKNAISDNELDLVTGGTGERAREDAQVPSKQPAGKKTTGKGVYERPTSQIPEIPEVPMPDNSSKNN